MNLIDFKNISVKIKLGLFITLFIIITLLLSYFVIIPSATKIVNIKNDIKAKRTTIEKKYEDRKKIGNVGKHIKEIKTNIQLLDKPFVNNNQKLEFITTLEGLATKNNVEQTIDLMTSEISDKNFYKIIPTRISVKGKFEDIFNYSLGIESLNEYLNVQYLKISSISETGTREEERKKVKLLIKADTFWCDPIKIK